MRISDSSKIASTFFIFISMLMILIILPASTLAQDITPTPDVEATAPEVPNRVDIQPLARDDEIETRLHEILTATGWFVNPEIEVQDGVVFLIGQTQTEDYRDWASNLATNTQDVTAVVNQMEVLEPGWFDINPLVRGLHDISRNLIRSIPLLGFSLIILFFAWIASRLMTSASRRYLQSQRLNILLRNVISRSIGLLVFLGGLFLVFQIAGLTSFALTILGGTGLLGLVLGIAFRDITENFLASIFLSVQNPFNVGDLVEINEVLGFVQRMTTRTTILMTLAGNHVQIPNATIYKSTIHNYTSNPNRRIDFTVGIGYDDSISTAQETVRQVLEAHPAVLNDPEHLVLVDNLGTSTVNLQIYFWLDGTTHSWLKVKSSVIRLVKRAIQDAGISMPDEARELIFPQGVPVEVMQMNKASDNVIPHPTQKSQPHETDSVSTNSEGDLSSEAEVIETQSRQSRTPETGENLLNTEDE